MAAVGTTATMAEDPRVLMRNIGELQKQPEYNFPTIAQALDSMDEPLNLIRQVVADRAKRKAEEDRRREANRALQQRLAADQADLLQQQEQQQEQEHEPELAPDPMTDVDMEPEVYQPLGLGPQQPLPAVDLTPLNLPANAVSFGTEPGSDDASESQWLLLQLLMANRQLFTFVGASDGASASTVLRVLYEIVSYGRNPYEAYQQMMQHYREAPPEALGWVPQLADFLNSLVSLGCHPARGHGGAHGHKRTTGQSASQQPQPSQQPPKQAAPGGGSSGGSIGGPGRPPVANLQCLLRLLTDLLGLHQQGRLDLGCGNDTQAVGRDLFTAMLRMLQDSDLHAAMYGDLRSALEALMQPWDEMLWRRLRSHTAEQVATMGPTHRGEYRLMEVVRGSSARLRSWQQAAAMQLLRRVLPQGRAGSGSTAGSSHRGRDEAFDLEELRNLLGRTASDAAANELKCALSGGRAGRGERVDYWRLMTVVQCAHMVVWNEVWGHEEEPAANSEEAQAAAWLFAYFKKLEQAVKAQNSMALTACIFLAECRTLYKMGLGVEE